MGFIDDVNRIAGAKRDQYSLIQEFGGTVSSTDRIDSYADIFRAMLESGPAPTKYYKCQAVDTATKTWSGFEAEDKGTYFTFSDIPTTGLSYIGYAPIVGEIYNEDGRISLAGLFNGVVEDTDTGEAVVFLAAGTTVSDTVAVIPTGRVEDGVYNL